MTTSRPMGVPVNCSGSLLICLVFEGLRFRVTFLSIWLPSKLSKPCIDLYYLSIRINFNDSEENSAALCLLRSCPNLQEIEMFARPEEQATDAEQTNFREDDNWMCLFGQQRVVKIVGISGVRSELDCIKFLLSNSPSLEKMTVRPASKEGGWDMVKELLHFR